MSTGVTDLPLKAESNIGEESEDLLDIQKYISGLKNFIENCPTPMSIAIQGDWGTGKTSLINCINQELFKDNVKTIYFNTWQYSQFNMDESLYFSFLSCLIEMMKEDSISQKIRDSAEKVMELVFKTGKKFIPYGDKIDEKAVLDLFKKQMDQAQSVAKIRDEFQNAVNEFLMIGDEKYKKAAGKRLVIFIDDLDRLNPGVAVELLEAIKLFMDVKQCVFVLAIDYDVVVQGVRKKFGNDVPLDKCRSFFDKIIQLPFHMPIESYDLKKLTEKYFGKYITQKYTAAVSDFIKSTIGPNPRTFKRLVNSFSLIQSVLDANNGSGNNVKGEVESAMLLGSLCMQLSAPELYTHLLTSSDWFSDEDEELFTECFEPKQTSDSIREIFKEYLTGNDDAVSKKIDQIDHAIESLGALLEVLYENEKGKDQQNDFLGHFKDVISLSSITSVSSGNDAPGVKRKAGVAVNSIFVEGKEYKVKDATEAVVKTFEVILENHKESLSLCVESINILTFDEAKNNSVFQKKQARTIGDKTIYIGTKTSFSDKCRHTNSLSRICSLPKGSIQWIDGKQIVYQN